MAQIRILIQKTAETEGIVLAADIGATVKMGDRIKYASKAQEVKIGKQTFWLISQEDIIN